MSDAASARAHYVYRAARADGSIATGEIGAPTLAQAMAGLLARGLHPLDVTAGAAEPQKRPASRRALAGLFQSVASLVSAGLPVERAIASSESLARGPLRHAVATARRELHEGRTLAQALAASHGVIPPLVVGMVRAGERGSRLGEALESVAKHLEQEADLVARVRQALAYPLLVATTGLVSIAIIGTVVVPRFADLLQDQAQLPLATRALLTGSSLLSRYGIQIGVVLAGVLWLGVAVLRRPQARRAADRMLLDLPVIGPVRHALGSARVARALGGMLASGMPLLPALDAASDAAGDAAIRERLRRARDRVAEGRRLAEALGQERALASGVLQLLGVGEASGRLASMASRAGALAAQDAERALRTLTGVLEPALVVGFGGLVAFVAAALLQAVYSIRPGGF